MKVIFDENHQQLFKIEDAVLKIFYENDNEIGVHPVITGETVNYENDYELNFGIGVFSSGTGPDVIKVKKPCDLNNLEIIIPNPDTQNDNDFALINVYIGEHFDTGNNIIKTFKEGNITKVKWSFDIEGAFAHFLGVNNIEICKAELEAELKIDYEKNN